MDSLHHPLLIVQLVNGLLDPVLRPIFLALGLHPEHEIIPDYLVMGMLIVLGWAIVGLVIKSRLSVENPSRFQIVIEDLVVALAGMLDEWIGPKGRRFMPLIGALGAFILIGNYIGLMPGLMAPTSNINVTVGCAITIWVYYHIQGVKAQGIVAYLKHFALPPGAPVWLAPLMLVIEVISHMSRVLSLTLRLFGNIFGEEMIIAILGLLVPYFVPLPMMALGLMTGTLQAYIFVLLSIIYLQGAVAVEHHDHHDEHAHGHETGKGIERAELAVA